MRRKKPRPGRTRHGATRLDHYRQIHDRVMRGHIASGFVLHDGVRFHPPEDGHIAVRGQIRCEGGLNIHVDKKLKIVSGKGPTAKVQTVEYHYNVFTRVGNVFRYDSPHEDHREHHHVHRFNEEGDETHVHDIYDVNEVPTLGDVIKEVQEHYEAPLL